MRFARVAWPALLLPLALWASLRPATEPAVPRGPAAGRTAVAVAPTGTATSPSRSVMEPIVLTAPDPAASPTREARQHIAWLREAVRSPDRTVNRPALVMLSDLGTPEAIDALVEVMVSRRDYALSSDAAAALARTPSEACVDALARVAREGGSDAVRLSALQSLAAMARWWSYAPAAEFVAGEGRAIAESIAAGAGFPALREEARSLMAFQF